MSIQSNLAVVLVQNIMDQTNSRVASQIGRGLSTKTPKIQPAPYGLPILIKNGRGLSVKSKWIHPAPDGLPILLRNGHGLSVKSKWIKLAPGRLLDRFLGSNVRARMKKSYQRQLVHH